jgi:hypothetical protein
LKTAVQIYTDLLTKTHELNQQQNA